jgi:simple sugar transport system permease protein
VRGAGERPEVLAAYGHSPLLIRYLAVVAGGMFAGIGGAQLSTAYTNAWFENMTQGRGFIAVALVIFAAWHPLRAVTGAYLFGACLALSPALQARGVGVNQFALDAIPYVVTIVVLVALGRRRAHSAPEALSRVFDVAPMT